MFFSARNHVNEVQRVSTAKKALRRNRPKVALFYDWLNQWGGAERVLLDLIKLFPQAPVYTLLHNPVKTPWLPAKTRVITSFINRLPLAKNHHRLYAPLYPLALEQFNFSQFDIVISTTTTFGHCLLTPPPTLFVCYCHTPNRQVWQNNHLKLYQKIDRIFAQRPDHFIANSQNIQKKIKKHYRRPSQIVYPGVNTSIFKPIKKPTAGIPHPAGHRGTGNYFLIVSRLVAHKKIDLAIQACQQLNLALKIIGSGRQFSQLKKHSANNTQFLGQVNQKTLILSYQNCAALICPQHEDFGLAPLEAMACGRPVIAFKKGGFLETIINGKTGLFFNKQTISSLKKVLIKFDSQHFKTKICRQQAQKFSRHRFMLNFKKITDQLWLKQSTI